MASWHHTSPVVYSIGVRLPLNGKSSSRLAWRWPNIASFEDGRDVDGNDGAVGVGGETFDQQVGKSGRGVFRAPEYDGQVEAVDR